MSDIELNELKLLRPLVELKIEKLNEIHELITSILEHSFEDGNILHDLKEIEELSK